MWLFLLFIAVPLIEIALFIQIGGLIGLWPTLLVVIVTAIAGTWLVRTQGLQTLARLQRSFEDLRDPTEPLAHGAMILFSGALLLTPGFFTDAVGFLLLVPAFRQAAFLYLRKRVRVQSFRMGQQPGPRPGPGPDPRGPAPGGPVIDGEYEEVDPPKQPTHGNSGWTRH
jgi:Protein affecting phage T7 exclusion by the F plasmid